MEPFIAAHISLVGRTVKALYGGRNSSMFRERRSLSKWNYLLARFIGLRSAREDEFEITFHEREDYKKKRWKKREMLHFYDSLGSIFKDLPFKLFFSGGTRPPIASPQSNSPHTPQPRSISAGFNSSLSKNRMVTQFMNACMKFHWIIKHSPHSFTSIDKQSDQEKPSEARNYPYSSNWSISKHCKSARKVKTIKCSKWGHKSLKSRQIQVKLCTFRDATIV